MNRAALAAALGLHPSELREVIQGSHIRVHLPGRTDDEVDDEFVEAINDYLRDNEGAITVSRAPAPPED